MESLLKLHAHLQMIQVILQLMTSMESQNGLSQEHLHALAQSLKLSDIFSLPLSSLSVKPPRCNSGCHVCLVKGSYDKWQQLYKLISL